MKLKRFAKYLLHALIIIVLFGLIFVNWLSHDGVKEYEEYNLAHRFSIKEIPSLECTDDHDCERLAIETKDIRYCNNVVGNEINQMSYETCYRDVAVALQDPSLCGVAPDAGLADLCYRDLGSKFSDPSICEKVIKRDYRGYCYYSIAYKTKDKSLCSKIPFFTYGFYEGNYRKACSRIK